MTRSQLKALMDMLTQYGEEEAKDAEELSIIKNAYDLVEQSLIDFQNDLDESIRADEDSDYSE